MIIYLQMIESPADQSKFETMYLEYKDMMYNIAYKILQNVHDAEDVVHQAFVTIAENILKIDDPMCPKTRGYIVTIVESRAIDIYRRKKAHPTVPYSDEVIDISVEYDGENELAGCILKLPARQRHILILKYSHGYELKEIAKMLGMTYTNALKLEQRAKAKLKALCEEAEIK